MTVGVTEGRLPVGTKWSMSTARLWLLTTLGKMQPRGKGVRGTWALAVFFLATVHYSVMILEEKA